MLGKEYFNERLKKDTHLQIRQPLTKDFFW